MPPDQTANKQEDTAPRISDVRSDAATDGSSKQDTSVDAPEATKTVKPIPSLRRSKKVINLADIPSAPNGAPLVPAEKKGWFSWLPGRK